MFTRFSLQRTSRVSHRNGVERPGLWLAFSSFSALRLSTYVSLDSKISLFGHFIPIRRVCFGLGKRWDLDLCRGTIQRQSHGLSALRHMENIAVWAVAARWFQSLSLGFHSLPIRNCSLWQRNNPLRSSLWRPYPVSLYLSTLDKRFSNTQGDKDPSCPCYSPKETL